MSRKNKNAFSPIHNFKPFSKIRFLGKSDQLVRKRNVTRKFTKKRKRVKNDAINQAKEASPHAALNATAMEDSVFGSASAGLSRSSQVVLLKARFPSGRTLIERVFF